ncbi:hypothetical protein JOB18_045004 [Solea senegalensis]|uniref:Uncharacterized protein n=1 Tax=Solea senegalensis TaxID=28829 RepID=A0AAV6QKJ8_SOLSE|nr:hypothetical protein JOB18_045004 [Solea senegalensis]
MLDSSHLHTQIHLLLFPTLAATTAATRAGHPTGVHTPIADPVGVHATPLVCIPLRVFATQAAILEERIKQLEDTRHMLEHESQVTYDQTNRLDIEVFFRETDTDALLYKTRVKAGHSRLFHPHRPYVKSPAPSALTTAPRRIRLSEKEQVHLAFPSMTRPFSLDFI